MLVREFRFIFAEIKLVHVPALFFLNIELG